MIPATAILVPVLNRPQNVLPLLESIEAATPEPHSVLFLASEGDKDEIFMLEGAQEDGRADFEVTAASRGSWACKINDGYAATEEPFIFTGADDLRFHSGWLAEALRVAETPLNIDTVQNYGEEPALPGVVGTNDLCNARTERGEHSTHSLVSRDYITAYGAIDQRGVVLHEGYAHEYADDELVQTAMARGVYAHAFESKVQHLHPMCSETDDDDTYRLGRSGTGRSRRHFNLRSRLWGGDKAFTTRRPRRMNR